jgi:hypothetical protein
MVVKVHNTKKSITIIRCVACGAPFVPEARAAGRQRFCFASECRKASRRDSQRRWLEKAENRGYFSGPENVRRVQEWRKANPDYLQRKRLRKNGTSASGKPGSGQHPPRKDVSRYGYVTGKDTLFAVLSEFMPQDACPVLQDTWASQTIAIVGLVAWLRGARGRVLQETIACDLNEIMSLGHAIFRELPPRRAQTLQQSS